MVAKETFETNNILQIQVCPKCSKNMQLSFPREVDGELRFTEYYCRYCDTTFKIQLKQ